MRRLRPHGPVFTHPDLRTPQLPSHRKTTKSATKNLYLLTDLEVLYSRAWTDRFSPIFGSGNYVFARFGSLLPGLFRDKYQNHEVRPPISVAPAPLLLAAQACTRGKCYLCLVDALNFYFPVPLIQIRNCSVATVSCSSFELALTCSPWFKFVVRRTTARPVLVHSSVLSVERIRTEPNLRARNNDLHG